MIRFPELESVGVGVAAFSEATDGDCAWMSPDGKPGPGRARICATCGVDADGLVLGRQVHGTAIAIVTSDHQGRGAHDRATALPKTDGLITVCPNIPLAVLVADCVPLYLVDPVTGAIGLIHAGRQGTFDGIARRAVGAMTQAFGANPQSIRALIGPSAGPDRYEVSEELAAAWTEAGWPATGRMLDLWGANATQLEAAGLNASQITITGRCTLGDTRFFSYRRGAGTARNMALLCR